MRLLLPLVPPGNHEHGRAIRSSDGNGTADNTRCGSPLLRTLVAVVVVREGIRVAVVAVVGRVASTVAA